MSILAAQYLEPGPEIISPHQARQHLRAAFNILPISILIVGWNLAEDVEAACAEEAARQGARLFRWQPLFTGDGIFSPRPEWQTIGMNGNRVAGFRGMDEFTFVCPNRPAVREAALEHLSDVLRSGTYQGVFLDRIRYSSPSQDPESDLACFCEDCRTAAAKEGLD
ncbi:MAG: hypothetical protein EHM70_20535, partial [Chloroflexota bacterium]